MILFTSFIIYKLSFKMTNRKSSKAVPLIHKWMKSEKTELHRCDDIHTPKHADVISASLAESLKNKYEYGF